MRSKRDVILRMARGGSSLLIPPIVNPWRMPGLLRSARGYVRVLKNARRYSRMAGGVLQGLRLRPSLGDAVQPAGIADPHYFYQDTWALRKIAEKRPDVHVDAGSRLDGFGAQATVLTRVVFVDIRVPSCVLPDLMAVSGDLTHLPFRTRAIDSLSCLHVIEHVGLGRYGDTVSPAGPERAAAELMRVLAPGGDLYLGTPVGREAVHFDSHRVFAPATIVALFGKLELVDFCGVDDAGEFHPWGRMDEFDSCLYGCGLFHFRKPC